MPSDLQLDTPGRPWPDRSTLRGRVDAWMTNQLATETLAEWAQTEVGQWLLPDLPIDDPVSIEVEVLLTLSTLELGTLHPARDGAALLDFLATPTDQTQEGWAAWFRHLRGEPDPTLDGHA